MCVLPNFQFVRSIASTHPCPGLAASLSISSPICLGLSTTCSKKRWKKYSSKVHEIFGQQVYFAAKGIGKGHGSYLMVISNIFHAEQALELYRERWGA